MIKFLLARSFAKQKGSRFPAPFLLRAGAEGTQRQRHCTNATPIFFPEKENGRRPSKRKAFRLAVSILNGLYASGMEVPARGVAAFEAAIRFASAPTTRCRSASLVEVQPISVYRQSHQCGERSKAAFRRQSAARQTSLAPHDSKARLLSDHNSQGFMAKPCTPHPHCAARAVLQATGCQCAGSRGRAPCVLLGVQGGYSLT